jgi:hypothetical protein
LFESFVELMSLYLIPPSSFQAKSTVEGERDLQPWKKEEGLREIPGNDLWIAVMKNDILIDNLIVLFDCI